MNTFEMQYKESGFESQRKYPNEGMIRFLASNFFRVPREERKNIRILEIGCGSGANLWMIAKENFDTYGVDISPTGIELCHEMMQHWDVNTNLKVGSMLELPYESEYFDAIVDVVSMQHVNINDHKVSYKEVSRCLKKGGKMFQWHLGAKSSSFEFANSSLIDELTVSNINNPEMPLFNNGQTCFLSKEIAETLIAANGFYDVVIESNSRTYNSADLKLEYLEISATKE